MNITIDIDTIISTDIFSVDVETHVKLGIDVDTRMYMYIPI